MMRHCCLPLAEAQLAMVSYQDALRNENLKVQVTDRWHAAGQAGVISAVFLKSLNKQVPLSWMGIFEDEKLCFQHPILLLFYRSPSKDKLSQQKGSISFKAFTQGAVNELLWKLKTFCCFLGTQYQREGGSCVILECGYSRPPFYQRNWSFTYPYSKY